MSLDRQLEEVATALEAGRSYLRRGRRIAIEALPAAIAVYGKTATAKRLGVSRPTLDAWLREAEKVD